MRSLLQDLTYGFRLLRRQPTFTFVAILILTLGIGINTAAFSVVNTLLLKPRVGNIGSELVGVYSRHRQRPGDYRAFSWADYEFLRGRRDLFRSVTASSFGLAGLKEGDRTRRVLVDLVPASHFETFGVTLPLGRTFYRGGGAPGRRHSSGHRQPQLMDAARASGGHHRPGSAGEPPGVHGGWRRSPGLRRIDRGRDAGIV